MSYDVEVATHVEPDPIAVLSWIADRGAVAEGELGASGGVWLRRRVRGGLSVGFNVAAPARVDLTDLQDPLRAAVLAPRWLIQLSAPAAADEKDIALMRSLSRQLAHEYQGAAYDQQTDVVISARGSRTFRPARTESRISVLELLWVMPPRRDASAALAFLNAVRPWPEARPTRFGTFEPLQGRLPLDDDAPFIEHWRERLVRDHGDSFFWTGTRPFLNGHVFFPIWSQPADASGQLDRVTGISLSVDGRVLERSTWREAIVELFSQMAQTTKAVFGAAYVRDGFILRGRGLWTDGKTEDAPDFTIVRGRWLGLPPAASWLTWYGAAYSSHLHKTLSETTIPVGDGLLLRIGADPPPRRELADRFPNLPAEVVWRERTRDELYRLHEEAASTGTRVPPGSNRAPAAWRPPAAE